MSWQGIFHALWIFLPAYVANMAPVFVAKAVPWWNAPMDGGRVGTDGQRLLGAGKTWRGLVGGAVLGGVTAVLVGWGTAYVLPGLLVGWDFAWHAYWPGHTLGHQVTCTPDFPCSIPVHAPPWAIFLFGLVVGAMALVGDAVKSYFKRRRGKEGGAPWFPYDQLDFVVFGLLGFLLAAPLLPAGWVRHALLDDWAVLATLIVLTPVLHLVVNRIGYWLGLKKVPW